MTVGQLIDLLSERDAADAVVVPKGDGYAPILGLRACGKFCMAITSEAQADIRYDDDDVPAVNSPLRLDPDPLRHLDRGEAF